MGIFGHTQFSFVMFVVFALAASMTLQGCGSSGSAGATGPAGPASLIIASVNPTEVKEGEQLRITGVGFGSTQGTSSITIGGVPATTISSWSDSVIFATVPAGAATGTVVVARSGVNSSPGYIVVLWAKENTTNNVAISTAAFDQSGPQLISDGSGGAIIAWQDLRSGTNYDIYAQRVSSVGEIQWAADGVTIATAAFDQTGPQLISDNSGGAIIAWIDERNGTRDIYAQRVNSAGTVQWTTDGVAISTAVNDQYNPQLVSDGSGGAIIAWQDYRSGTNYDIYAQRVNSAGVVQWTANGVAISTTTGWKLSPQLVSDGSGGAIITWQDSRSGNDDIYAQRVNSAGAVQWTADGIAICAAANNQDGPLLISDNSGGAIIVWSDGRSGTNRALYAQRVNSVGAVQWTPGGIAVSTAAAYPGDFKIVYDGSGGAIIAWDDLYRSGTNYDIYAQRVNSAGAAQWTADGIAISVTANDKVLPQLTSDGSGGAIITWADGEGGVSADIYAQRVSSAGAVQWTANGVAIATATNDQYFPQLISDGSGGAIITWMDSRNDINYYDIYAQGISASGRQ